ncbi:hypothetical protein R3P38DRAFT_2809550 [Favolaschia claudopus]|uniref:Uncharacterized protein n=1 Tax=Favolaschia claudopus TaxID=2862362 RepID=A0AAV9ZEK5_9AGAR
MVVEGRGEAATNRPSRKYGKALIATPSARLTAAKEEGSSHDRVCGQRRAGGGERSPTRIILVLRVSMWTSHAREYDIPHDGRGGMLRGEIQKLWRDPWAEDGGPGQKGTERKGQDRMRTSRVRLLLLKRKPPVFGCRAGGKRRGRAKAVICMTAVNVEEADESLADCRWKSLFSSFRRKSESGGRHYASYCAEADVPRRYPGVDSEEMTGDVPIFPEGGDIGKKNLERSEEVYVRWRYTSVLRGAVESEHRPPSTTFRRRRAVRKECHRGGNVERDKGGEESSADATMALALDTTIFLNLRVIRGPSGEFCRRESLKLCNIISLRRVSPREHANEVAKRQKRR